MDDQTFNPANFAKPQRLSAQAPAEHTFNPGAIRQRIEQETQQEESVLTAPLGPVPTWSFSRLLDYEDCPYKVYLKSVEKAPDPSGPAAERGSLVHEHIENFIQGEHDNLLNVPLKRGMKPCKLEPYAPIIERLREGWYADEVEVEGDWGFTRNWDETGFFAKDVWGRMKLDAIHFESKTSAHAFDWKTGRKFGNELKHGQQGLFYAFGAFMRYPQLEFIRTEFVYVDQNEAPLTNNYSRERAMLMRPMIEKRTNKLTTATEFPPKPSMNACRFCPHRVTQEGEDKPRCDYAYQEL